MPTFRFIVFLSLIGTWLLTASPAVAQLNQPVYPVYDGFLQAEEGIYVISYAYFSHNYDVVTVPLGTDNSFELEPSDRLQPMSFQPGHHRFQCVMVMGPNFTGGLQWTLSYAGTTTSTSEDMLQYNWELDAGTQRRVLRDIDVANAPRGICLNRSPLVRILGLRDGPGPRCQWARQCAGQLSGADRCDGIRDISGGRTFPSEGCERRPPFSPQGAGLDQSGKSAPLATWRRGRRGRQG